MLTRPKLMLPFQIARAMVLSPSKRPPPRPGTQDACRGKAYEHDSLPAAPVRPVPASIISNFYRFRHQRRALAAAPSLLLADRSRLRPPAVDRLRGVVPRQPDPQGAVQHRAAVPTRPSGEHAGGRAHGHRARLPERPLAERRHVLSGVRVPPSAAVAMARRGPDRARRGAVAPL